MVIGALPQPPHIRIPLRNQGFFITLLGLPDARAECLQARLGQAWKGGIQGEGKGVRPKASKSAKDFLIELPERDTRSPAEKCLSGICIGIA